MVEFETLVEKETKFGKNNFLEIAKKKAVTEEGENMFISIARGFFTRDGGKKYKNSIALPIDKEIVKFMTDALKELLKA